MQQPGKFAQLQKPSSSPLKEPLSAQKLIKIQKKKRRKEKISFGRRGPMEVRLADTKKDIKKAQRLRYNVFYKELNAIADLKTKIKRRDKDQFDKLCDHLLVIDHEKNKKKNTVGTYRLMAQNETQDHGGFYSQSEYNLIPLLEQFKGQKRFLELGRSCVLKSYRNKSTIELLWHGLWTYMRQNNFDVAIGCASFPGTDPKAHALPLSFLHHFASAPQNWQAKAHDYLYVDMNRMEKDEIDQKKALKAMPPLIKAYLRLGAFIGDGAVVDYQFDTTDVLIILPIENINPRYFAKFGSPEETTSKLVS